MSAPLDFVNVIVTTPLGPQAPSTLPYTVVPIGIGPPNFIEITFAPGNSTIPFSSVVGGLFIVTRPDGSIDTFQALLVSSTSTQLVIGYLFDGGEITLAGIYNVSVQLQIGTSGLVPANPFQLLGAPLNALPPSVVASNVTPTNSFPIITSISVGLISAPFDMTQFVVMGQSLGAGFFGTPVINSGGMLPHQKLFDSSGVYDITQPHAVTLSLVEADGPLRPITTGLAYPANIQGETPELGFARAVRAVAQAEGYADFACALTNVAQGGQPMSVIQKGGTGNSYAAWLYELTAIRALYLAANPSKKHGVGACLLKHGEADTQYPTMTSRVAYATDLRNLQANVQTDSIAATSQGRGVPMLMVQMCGYPSVDVTNDTTNPAMGDVHNGTSLIVAGADYCLAHYVDNFHLINIAYEQLGEIWQHAYTTWLQTGRWDPLRPTNVARNGAGAIVTYTVPVAPMVFDNSLPQPHATGRYAPWALGQGFEAYDGLISGSGAIASLTNNGGLIQVNLNTGFTHSYNPGDSINISNQFFSAQHDVNLLCQRWTVGTVVSSTAFTLSGSSFAALQDTFQGGPQCTIFRFLTITQVPVISGSTITLSFDRTPGPGFVVGYAMYSEIVAAGTAGGFQGGYAQGTGGRGGRLRDSDPYIGPSTGSALPNRGLIFSTTVP